MSESPIEDFIQTMGLMWSADGGPRIAGQIMGYLLLEGEPRTLAQMCDALQISKGSASTNARLLEAKGLARRVHPVGSRQDAFLAVPHPGPSMLKTVALRLRRQADEISRISAQFPEDEGAAQQRVVDFAEFYRKSADFMDEWTARIESDRGDDPKEN
ncbi:DNA-binding transcriptional regulator GbsR, MarR family [Pseudooceanicola antarcticus]|uniref:Transcriptional regulator n=1 Tax=Pseudooceanicola antarcticus TaxID=1247613 RepID=A0A285IK01_9RHOB|nr:MarR family transcriptional regulator [Pseudooceanicola antarcticus]PJE28759.1 transcriptional regulator [Pseudooceanicola antarcticus]SNY48340.1 DNA-binding transcriptional regulator GbsR, MarR family [Pseudooceanicola antarcticus]